MSGPTRPRRLHIDTDFAGDPDDACAVAMVLGWPGVEITGITTTADPDGRRAGYLRLMLDSVARRGIPIAVGAGVSSTTGRTMGEIPDHDRYWGSVSRPAPDPVDPGAALELLDASIEGGATIAAIGPLTNLADLERARPGRLADASVVAMGGWLDPVGSGLPPWGPQRDSNVVCDLDAAAVVASAAGAITWSTIPGTIRAQLRQRDLPRLRAAGLLGELLARASVAHGADHGLPELARAHAGLANDLVNFHWDPVTCAVALGWAGAKVADERVRAVRQEDAMTLVREPNGRPAGVVVAVDADVFTEHWLECVVRASGHGQ